MLNSPRSSKTAVSIDRAVGYLRRSIEEYKDPNGDKNLQLQQILGAWGQFEPLMTHPAGKGATVAFRFRNGRRVRFEAHQVLVDKVLRDVKEYIESRPPQVDWQRIDVNDIGSRLVRLNQQQYMGRLVARWELELDPPAGHFDRRISVATPLQQAGAYLLTARMDGGNSSHIMVCLDDTVIVTKMMSDKAYYFIADSRSGEPVPRADVELFGWQMVQVNGKNEFRVETKDLSLRADDFGQVFIPANNLGNPRGQYQWLCIARTPAGRFAHLGFSPVWAGHSFDQVYDQVRVYTITDRPVYRPGQPVRFKFWVARSRYDQPRATDFAHQTFTVEIHNPKGEKVLTKQLVADAFGGLDGTFELPSDAGLGVYQLMVVNHGGGSFRVEEYKKPEFEVNVEAPTKPIMLGEKVAATIKARYYFGSPVAEARVKYKVSRTRTDQSWYPAGAGTGSSAMATGGLRSDSTWYPGWSQWGVHRPSPWWWNRASVHPRSSPRPKWRSGPTARSPSRSTRRLPESLISTRTRGTRSRPR